MTSQARNIVKVVAGVVGAAYASQTKIKIETENVKIENPGLGEENVHKVLDTGVKIASTSIIGDVLTGDYSPSGGK